MVDTEGLVLQDRAAFLAEQPVLARLGACLQSAHFSRWRAAHDAPPPGPTPDWVALRVLTLADPPARVDRYVLRLAQAHARLTQALGLTQSALWPLARAQRWRQALDSRSHPPLRRARQALADTGMQARFNGALWFDADHAPSVVRLWFWAERCGAFSGGLVSAWPVAAGVLMATLCPQGNLHLEVYGDGALQALDRHAGPCAWQPVQGHCVAAWRQGAAPARSAIAGRSLNV